jgi:hypothetical protein
MTYAARKHSIADALRLVTELYVTKFYALGPQQRTQIQKLHDKLWKYYAIPEGADGHFRSCPWGQGAPMGPDTCECVAVSYYTAKEVESLAAEITNIPNDPAATT